VIPILFYNYRSHVRRKYSQFYWMIDTLVSPIKFRYFNAVFSVGVHCRIVHFFLLVTVLQIFWRCCWNYNPPVMTGFVSLFTHHKTPLLDRCCAIPFVWCANSNLLIDHKFWVLTSLLCLKINSIPGKESSCIHLMTTVSPTHSPQVRTSNPYKNKKF
jgi:hypothetical protein